jgi:hypothetical protein
MGKTSTYSRKCVGGTAEKLRSVLIILLATLQGDCIDDSSGGVQMGIQGL